MGSTWGLWAKLGSLSVVETWRASEKMHSSSLRGFGTFDSYEGCRGLYPATSRLQSVPPRFYDIVDGESGRVLASDLTSGTTRARSMIRQSRLAEERAWPQPLYGDMVIGPTASAGPTAVNHRHTTQALEDAKPPMTAQDSVITDTTTTKGPRISHSRVNQHMPRFSTRCRERVSVPPICPDISALTRR